MSTIYRCDGCGDEFQTEGPLTAVAMTVDGTLIQYAHLCDDCDPERCVEGLSGHLRNYIADQGADE